MFNPPDPKGEPFTKIVMLWMPKSTMPLYRRKFKFTEVISIVES
jgi:hypothetical protein